MVHLEEVKKSIFLKTIPVTPEWMGCSVTLLGLNLIEGLGCRPIQVFKAKGRVPNVCMVCDEVMESVSSTKDSSIVLCTSHRRSPFSSGLNLYLVKYNSFSTVFLV